MVAECNKGYPYLENDIRELKTRRGIQTYLFDTLIDVDILGYGKQEATTSRASEATSHANGHDHNEKIETSALDVRNGSLKAPPTP
ncbi:hypothetical protein FA13DRAFT_1747444 [Coprinellus micaceus]|uniref:Uncharacterized protein n=1 Tax=Coprinellus micaceus TaxID=71717 RepID=A0A4Y7S3H0_COPMI|nr:hypothetical protein FA13DRAFT_1747444 [Coprinellus micaceus]